MGQMVFPDGIELDRTGQTGMESEKIQTMCTVSGILAIRESAQRVVEAPIAPPRVLKVLWLLPQVKFIPRTAEVIAKLLVRHVETDLHSLRVDVEKTLLGLQSAGYVARDEATGEYKYLNERERTIEQEVQTFTCNELSIFCWHNPKEDSEGSRW